MTRLYLQKRTNRRQECRFCTSIILDPTMKSLTPRARHAKPSMNKMLENWRTISGQQVDEVMQILPSRQTQPAETNGFHVRSYPTPPPPLLRAAGSSSVSKRAMNGTNDFGSGDGLKPQDLCYGHQSQSHPPAAGEGLGSGSGL